MTVLVTGYKSGIGKSLVELYSKNISPNDIIVMDKDEIYYSLSDLQHPLASSYILRSVDTIVDCGFSNEQRWIHEDPTGSLFIKSMEENVKKLYKLYSEFLKSLRENKGVFIGIGSNSSHNPMTCSSEYCADKTAYEMVLRVMAREEDRLVGKCNNTDGRYCSFICINPVLIDDTPMPINLMNETSKKRGWSKEKTYEDYHKHLHHGIALKTQQVVNFLYYLTVTDRVFARQLSGSVLNIGGEL